MTQDVGGGRRKASSYVSTHIYVFVVRLCDGCHRRVCAGACDGRVSRHVGERESHLNPKPDNPDFLNHTTQITGFDFGVYRVQGPHMHGSMVLPLKQH